MPEAEATQPVKDGWRTSEFWVSKLALLLTALYVSDIIPTSGVVTKVAAVTATMLTSLGYTVMRTKAKS